MSETVQSSKLAPESAGREKHWEELWGSEKIERMRLEVKRIMRTIESLMKVSNNMKVHKHLDGQPVIPLDFYPGGESERSSRSDKYF